jgi:Nodulation protein Z (NodZ)
MTLHFVEPLSPTTRARTPLNPPTRGTIAAVAEKFVVTRPFPGSGIGSNLASFAGAVWLAGRLGREVIVDWRNSDFLQDKSANLYTEFLEPVTEIQGVGVRYARETESWDIDREDVRALAPSEVGDVLSGGSDSRYLVLTAYHAYERIEAGGDALERFRRLREFYGSIRPREDARRKIEAFATKARLGDSFVVAVNIATGNGDYRKGTAAYGRVKIELFDHQERFLRMLALARRSALRRLPDYLRERALTFVATDDGRMRELLMRLPNAVTRREVFPPPGAGRSFADYDVPGYTDRDAFTDIVCDHFLLARCNAIIRNPSMFSAYALFTTDFYNGNLRNVETMYPRYLAEAIVRRARRAPAALRHRVGG